MLCESCLSCRSAKNCEFPAEINIHFPGTTGFDKPTIWVSPDVYICMNCGLAKFTVPEAELLRLASAE